LSGFEAAMMKDTDPSAAGMIAMIAAVASALATCAGLLVIALFSMANLMEAQAWAELGLLIAGVVAAVAAVPLSLAVGRRVLWCGSVPWQALVALGMMGAVAIGWSLKWVNDPGDWPFFGGPALVFGCAAAVLVLMAVTQRGDG
jgi:cation transport ATPase